MPTAQEIYQPILNQIQADGLYKTERTITTPQDVTIGTVEAGDVLNFCANNYLGLARNKNLIAAATQALQQYGFGLASVRFICGTQAPHQQLESAVANFLNKDDAILYTSCFDANTGLFETLLGPEDAVLSDALNHASIIDGVRLSKAQRYRYEHGDMADLKTKLEQASDARIRLIATDGVFSMDGDIAPLDHIVELAQTYDAWVMVDDSHATGFVGKTGRGSAEHHGVLDQIDIITSTFGKALGGASGGFTAARQEIVDILRQRSRPYLFSNTLPPPLVAASLKVFEMLTSTTELRDQLEQNAAYFRDKITLAGFDIRPGEHPIIPIMLYEAHLAQKMAARLLEKGIYVVGFFFPVVPRDQARIRVQISSAHTREDLDRAITAFVEVGEELGILKG